MMLNADGIGNKSFADVGSKQARQGLLDQHKKLRMFLGICVCEYVAASVGKYVGAEAENIEIKI